MLRLGLAETGCPRYRNKEAIPTLDVMIKLAYLAGVPAEIGLIDRAIWEAKVKHSIKAKVVYRTIRNRLSGLL